MNGTFNKIVWSIMGFLFLISGFLAGHWFNRMENNVLEAKAYTDYMVAQSVKEMQPYLNNLDEMKKTVAETNEQVARITSFMEYKYGMPEKKRRK